MVWPYLFFHHQLKASPLLFFLSPPLWRQALYPGYSFCLQCSFLPSSPDEFLFILRITVQASLLQAGLSFPHLPREAIAPIIKSLSNKHLSFAGFVRDVTLHSNKFVNTLFQKVCSDSFLHEKFNNHFQKELLSSPQTFPNHNMLLPTRLLT